MSRIMTNFPYAWRMSVRKSLNVSEFVYSTSFTWILSDDSAPNILDDFVLNVVLTVLPPPTCLHPYPALAPSWTPGFVSCKHRMSV